MRTHIKIAILIYISTIVILSSIYVKADTPPSPNPSAKLQDGYGNKITSTSGTTVRSLDVHLDGPVSATIANSVFTPLYDSIVFGGTIIDPRSRNWSLSTGSDSVVSYQGGPWSFGLPSGASTSSLQTSGNTYLQSIDTKLSSSLAISAVSLPLPSGAATELTLSSALSNLSSINTKLPTQGQKTKAQSFPVVLSSDSDPLPVTGSFSFSDASNSSVGLPPPAIAKVVAGTDGTNVRILKTKTDGTQLVEITSGSVTVLNPVNNVTVTGTVSANVISTVLPTGAATASNQIAGNLLLTSIDSKLYGSVSTIVTNTITTSATGVTPVSGNVSINNLPSVQIVSGTVLVGNLPSTQAVSGSVVVSSGNVSVSNFPSVQTVSGSIQVSNLPAVQSVSGSVSVLNFPSTQTVAGQVSVANIVSVSSTGITPIAGNVTASRDWTLSKNTDSVTTSGTVSVISSSLPIGAATSENQSLLQSSVSGTSLRLDGIQTTVSSIDTKVATAANQGLAQATASATVTAINSNGTKLDTVNTNLVTINSSITTNTSSTSGAIGAQTTAINSQSVTNTSNITSRQDTLQSTASDTNTRLDTLNAKDFATSAKQDSMQATSSATATSIFSIDSKLNSQATAANQAITNSTLSTIDGKITITSEGVRVDSEANVLDFTSTNLAASATYTSPWFDTTRFGSGANLYIRVDQPSTYSFEISPDQISVDTMDTSTIPTSFKFQETQAIPTKYWRYSVTNNGASATTSVYAAASSRKIPLLESIKISDRTGNDLNFITSSPTTVSTVAVPVSIKQDIQNTYSASFTGLVTATTPTDIFTITGAVGKRIRIKYIYFDGEQTTSSTNRLYLVKRSTANTLGTSTTVVAVPEDSTQPAAKATVRAYTVNPTLGTLVGNLSIKRVRISTAGAAQNPVEFGGKDGTTYKDYVLNSASEVIALNLGSVSILGNILTISIVWTEE